MEPLSVGQRDLLIGHIDGRAILVNVRTPFQMQRQRSLVARGLLRWDRITRPTKTYITEAGRAELAKLLAIWADVLSPEAMAGGLARIAGIAPNKPEIAVPPPQIPPFGPKSSHLA